MKNFLQTIWLLSMLIFLPTLVGKAQSTANYTFARTATGSLVADDNSNAIDMTTGQTNLIANNVDDGVSTVTNIGFDFVYMGRIYTQFYASSNGYIGLGGTTYDSFVNDLTDGINKIIAPFWDDLHTDNNANAGVFSKVVGTAPNRCLVVQFTRMNIDVNSTTNDGTYQARLYETTGVIQFVYGSMQVGNGGTTVDASIGFTNGNTDNSFICLTTITATPSVTTLAASEVNNLVNTATTGNITDLHNNADGTRRRYTFTPIAAATAPTGLNFTSVGTSGMTLNWTDNATTETGYVIYRSDDGGTTYNLLTNIPLAANTNSYVATGLASSTTYFWRVFAINEGRLSTALQGSQATAAPPSFNGNYDVPTGAYTSLTNAGGIFEAINAGQLSGNVTITITGNLTSETGTHTLNQWTESPASSNYTITIQSNGTTRTISGTTVATDAPMIHFNGADRVTINGGAGKNLVFRNTNATASNTGATIQFSNTSTNCTLTNCIIENNTTDTNLATLMIKDNTTDANNIIISNCELRDAIAGTTGKPYRAFYLDSPNTWVRLDNNQIYNWNNYGIDIFQTTLANACEITNNHLYQTSTSTVQQLGLSFDSQSSSGHIINGNFIGGNAINAAGTWTNSASSTFTAAYIRVGNASATTFNNNTIQNITLTGTSSLTFRGLAHTGNGNTTVSNLTLQNISLTNTSSGTISGIEITTNPTTTIQNSTFNNLQYTNASSTGGSVRAIFTSPSSTGDITNIQNNTFSNIASSSGMSAGSSTSNVSAIHADSGTENITINQNTIYNIQATHATANTACYGIFLNNSSVNSNISRNKIYNITNVTSNTSGRIAGLYAWYGTFTTTHNQITITNGTNTNAINVYGIWEATLSSASGTHYYNSIYIGGSANTGSRNSYAYLRDTYASTILMRNNIFINARVNTGTATGLHYTIGSINTTLASGWAATASNYNFFANSQTANVATWSSTSTPSSETFATWKTNSGGDANSWYAQITTGTSDHSNINPSELFNDIANGDLNIKVNNPACWFANGKGVQVTGQQLDFGSSSAVRSVVVSTGGTDLGADEFTPTATPIVAKVTGTIGAGNTQTFEFAGRTIFSINWKASGTLPTSLGTGLAYYSGEWPRFPNAGARYFNAYWRIDPVGGSGYAYDVSLYYDEALIGTILSEGVARLSKQPTTAVSNQWYTYIGTASSPNTTANTMNSVTDLTSFSDFTASDDSAPLPVSLDIFEANRKDAENVALTWKTISEVGLKQILVEKSANGYTFLNLAYQEIQNKPTGANYTYTDREGQASYYRLLFMFDNGQTSYSPIRYVEGGKPSTIILYPNPMQGQVTWKVSEDLQNETDIHIQISDIKGNLVGKYEGDWNMLADKINQHKDSWKTGVYIAKISVAGKIYNLKLMK